MAEPKQACWDRTEGCCMTDAFERGKRRCGGPQVVFFGGDDAREEWTWECRFPHQSETRTFNDAPTWAEAVAELTKHHERHHGARGRHGCPRCGAPVCNRAGDPERTDLCPPCTVIVFSGSTPQPEEAQIAAPVPAVGPDSGSGDSRTLGGVSGAPAVEHVSVGRFPAFRAGDVVMGPCPVTGGVIVERRTEEA